MSIIYSYPIIVPALDDLFVLSDASSTPKYSTRQATLSSIKDSLDVVDSITATLPISVSSATGSPDISSRAYGGGSITGHVPAGGSVGQYLGGDGQWATASGSGTVTGTGANNQIATWTNASNIEGNNELTFDSNTATLQVGDFGGNGGLIIARAADGVQSGILSMENKEGGKYLNLKVNDDIMSQTYNLVLPSNAASSGGQVLSSVGATGELAWTTPSAGGTVTSVTASSPIGSTGGTAPVISLAASGVVAGSYTHSNITVSDKGLVTAASNGVLGYTPIDYAAADTTVTGSDANKAHAYQATPDSTFTCSRAQIMLNRVAPSFSGTYSGIAVGIYTRVSTGIGTGAGNILLGQGSKSVWSSDPYGSITLTPVNTGDLDLVGGVAYVIVVRCIGANAATGLLGVSGITDVLIGANFASTTASLPATINSELAIGATTFRPAITLHSV